MRAGVDIVFIRALIGPDALGLRHCISRFDKLLQRYARRIF